MNADEKISGVGFAVTTNGEVFAFMKFSDLAVVPAGQLAAICLSLEAAAMARESIRTKAMVRGLIDAELARGAAPALATNQTVRELVAAEEGERP